ncbi:heat shock protein beta-1-like [Lingula anatina]|uniref:Heat shock protein beta-1-like n=1 Tax=Lingula anatina TaxID=7574 RepID=A0A2R2MIJ1_LINAN|nr:heat shock protein beta-1-like [Lingula anatina]|eukprot:XP_023930009.1 heat shock protein beta-1-like [Lingula anatina]
MSFHHPMMPFTPGRLPIFWDTTPFGYGSPFDRDFDRHRWTVGNWSAMPPEMAHQWRQFDRQMNQMSEDMRRNTYGGLHHLTPYPSIGAPHMSTTSALTFPEFPEARRLTENKSIDFPVVEEGGRKKFKVQFDVHQFRPEELIVKTSGNTVTVHAKHEEKAEGRHQYAEYMKTISLPEGVDATSLMSTLRHDGVLALEAPLPESMSHIKPKERPIAIQHH